MSNKVYQDHLTKLETVQRHRNGEKIVSIRNQLACRSLSRLPETF